MRALTKTQAPWWSWCAYTPRWPLKQKWGQGMGFPGRVSKKTL